MSAHGTDDTGRLGAAGYDEAAERYAALEAPEAPEAPWPRAERPRDLFRRVPEARPSSMGERLRRYSSRRNDGISSGSAAGILNSPVSSSGRLRAAQEPALALLAAGGEAATGRSLERRSKPVAMTVTRTWSPSARR